MEPQNQNIQVEPGRVIDSLKLRIANLINEISMAEAVMNQLNEQLMLANNEIVRLAKLLEDNGIDPAGDKADVIDLDKRRPQEEASAGDDDEPSGA